MKKLGSCPYGKVMGRWKRFDDICMRLDRIPQCDGQTDRRTELLDQYRALHGTHADGDNKPRDAGCAVKCRDATYSTLLIILFSLSDE